jgi:MerR family transcriptional regulator, redox-sensitive transcriptional activator SoxR
MEELSIGEVARLAGMRTSALRYYESIGLLPEPRRVNGRRRYDPSTVQMLSIIHLAQQAGFTMAEIQALFYGFAAETPPGERWRPLVEQKLQEVEALIARAHKMQAMLKNLLRCGCARLEDCLITDVSVANAGGDRRALVEPS